MFERLKKVFGGDKQGSAQDDGEAGRVSEWAGTRGMAFSGGAEGKVFTLDGKVQGKTWRFERGRPSRNFIRGEELRARAELGVNEDAAVLIMNRPLKDTLEKRAYELYTDSLQTTADPNLPEEMRWLSMYQEYGWDALPKPFWDRYSVLADDRDHAMAWVNPKLGDLMLNWPQPAPHAQVPFMLMLLRGKGYLRMEYTPAGMHTLEHAIAIFTWACESALATSFDPPQR